jgi:hypothetical protein
MLHIYQLLSIANFADSSKSKHAGIHEIDLSSKESDYNGGPQTEIVAAEQRETLNFYQSWLSLSSVDGGSIEKRQVFFTLQKCSILLCNSRCP